MKIKLANYPYNEFNIGDICDFGEEKNASLVSLQRAVFVGENKKETKREVRSASSGQTKEEVKVKETKEPQVQEEQKETSSTETKAEEPSSGKKLLENELQQEVQNRKQQIKSTPLRGPGGKFLSKKESSETGSEQVKKMGFWDKLKS